MRLANTVAHVVPCCDQYGVRIESATAKETPKQVDSVQKKAADTPSSEPQDRYAEFLPVMSQWIQQTLEASAQNAKSVESFRFPRLPHYFSEQLLKTTRVVMVDRLPVPPLSAWGFSEFADFETQPMVGITYLDTYFLLPDAAGE